MKRAGVALFGLGLAACSTGSGAGEASGYIYEYGCNEHGDYGATPDGGATAEEPVPYDLDPSYFAGEPIDDLRNYRETSAIMSNRLIIRLQRSGKQIELNDVLTFDVPSSYEVARCVRGRVIKTDAGVLVNDWDEANCYRDPADPNGPGRLRVQWDAHVNASLTLHATCKANLVASAVSAPVPLSYAANPAPLVANGAWDSWVELSDFGTARQVDQPPEGRKPVWNKFRVDYGDRVYASRFFLTLVDGNVVSAAINNRPRPSAAVGGRLGGDEYTGRFDFTVKRGQGAQFFP